MLKNPPLRPEFETYPERKKGQTGQEKDLLHIWEMNHVRPDRRIVTIYIEPRRLRISSQIPPPPPVHFPVFPSSLIDIQYKYKL